MKLVWDNNRQVPPAKDNRSHMRHITPSADSVTGDSAFSRTYRHIMTIGAHNMQQHCKEHWLDTWRDGVASDMVDSLFADLDLSGND